MAPPFQNVEVMVGKRKPRVHSYLAKLLDDVMRQRETFQFPGVPLFPPEFLSLIFSFHYPYISCQNIYTETSSIPLTKCTQISCRGNERLSPVCFFAQSLRLICTWNYLAVLNLALCMSVCKLRLCCLCAESFCRQLIQAVLF